MGVPGGVGSVRKIPEEIIAEHFPNLMEILYVQEAQQFLNNKNTETPSKHDSQIVETQNKEKNLKRSRRTETLLEKEPVKRLTTDTPPPQYVCKKVVR